MSSVVCLLHSKDWTLEDSTVSCMYFISAVVLLPIFLHQMMIDHHHLHYVLLCSCCISRLNPRGFNCQLYFISTVVLHSSFFFSRWLIIISIISIISIICCLLHFFISIISSVVLCIQRFDLEEFNCSRGRGYKFKFLILRVQGLGILGVEKKIVLEGYSKSFCTVWRCIWLRSSNVCVLFPWASFCVLLLFVCDHQLKMARISIGRSARPSRNSTPAPLESAVSMDEPTPFSFRSAESDIIAATPKVEESKSWKQLAEEQPLSPLYKFEIMGFLQGLLDRLSLFLQLPHACKVWCISLSLSLSHSSHLKQQAGFSFWCTKCIAWEIAL